MLIKMAHNFVMKKTCYINNFHYSKELTKLSY